MKLSLPDADHEPIRRNLYVAASVVAVATVLGVLGVASDWTPQVVAGALSLGLIEFAAIAYGVERARDRAWAPANHDAEVARRDQALDEIASAEVALEGLSLDDPGDVDPGV